MLKTLGFFVSSVLAANVYTFNDDLDLEDLLDPKVPAIFLL